MGSRTFEHWTHTAPIALVVASRMKEEPVRRDQPVLELPLPAPYPYEPIRSRDDAREPEAPTRGVKIFDMI